MRGIIYTKDIFREIVPKIIQDEASSLNGRTIQLIRELKMQDTNSYLYLLMEDMLFATAEGLSRRPGTPEEIVTEYLKELYKKKE